MTTTHATNGVLLAAEHTFKRFPLPETKASLGCYRT